MTQVQLLWDGDITLFAASLDHQEPLDHLLSVDELARAERFRFPGHRRRYVAGRGLLRTLLAERVGLDPRFLEITQGAYGKPRLEAHPDLSFNLSHAGATALYAFAVEGEIGVDVEQVRAVDPVRLARTCFSETERHQLLELPPPRRLGAFFDGWVRKEAVIKADGRGMAMPLDSFSVRLVGSPHMEIPPPQPSPAVWHLQSVPVGPGARAAVAQLRLTREPLPA